jgi:hypothetical protein
MRSMAFPNQLKIVNLERRRCRRPFFPSLSFFACIGSKSRSKRDERRAIKTMKQTALRIIRPRNVLVHTALNRFGIKI